MNFLWVYVRDSWWRELLGRYRPRPGRLINTAQIEMMQGDGYGTVIHFKSRRKLRVEGDASSIRAAIKIGAEKS